MASAKEMNEQADKDYQERMTQWKASGAIGYPPPPPSTVWIESAGGCGGGDTGLLLLIIIIVITFGSL